LIEEPVGVVIGFVIAGIAGGFLSSWMSFNASGEKFDSRKHGNALITGALSGMTIGIAAVAKMDQQPEQPTAADIALLLFITFLAATGIDRLRSNGSKMVTRHAEQPAAAPAAATPPPKPE
jgi:hypothetical protein